MGVYNKKEKEMTENKDIKMFEYYNDYRLIEKYLGVDINEKGENYLGSDEECLDFENAFNYFKEDEMNSFKENGINVGVMMDYYKNIKDFFEAIYFYDFNEEDDFFEDFADFSKRDMQSNWRDSYKNKSVLRFDKNKGYFEEESCYGVITYSPLLTMSRETMEYMIEVVGNFNAYGEDEFIEDYGYDIHAALEAMLENGVALNLEKLLYLFKKRFQKEGKNNWYFKGERNE